MLGREYRQVSVYVSSFSLPLLCPPPYLVFLVDTITDVPISPFAHLPPALAPFRLPITTLWSVSMGYARRLFS